MSNYAPTKNPGETRQRIRIFAGMNSLNGLPAMQFQEETVIRLSDGTERSLGDARNLTVTYQPGKVIDAYDLATDEVTGTTTHDAVFAAIYALARSAQVEADTPADPIVAPVSVPVTVTDPEATAP